MCKNVPDKNPLESHSCRPFEIVRVPVSGARGDRREQTKNYTCSLRFDPPTTVEELPSREATGEPRGKNRILRRLLATEFLHGQDPTRTRSDNHGELGLRAPPQQRDLDCTAGVSVSPANVDPITALCYLATIDGPTRFKKSRSVGAYVGLKRQPANQDAFEPPV